MSWLFTSGVQSIGAPASASVLPMNIGASLMTQMVKNLPAVQETLEKSPVDTKEMKLVHPKENDSRIFIGRTDAEAEAPAFWPPDERAGLLEKDSDAGKDGRQKEKRMAEDEMVR